MNAAAERRARWPDRLCAWKSLDGKLCGAWRMKTSIHCYAHDESTREENLQRLARSRRVRASWQHREVSELSVLLSMGKVSVTRDTYEAGVDGYDCVRVKIDAYAHGPNTREILALLGNPPVREARLVFRSDGVRTLVGPVPVFDARDVPAPKLDAEGALPGDDKLLSDLDLGTEEYKGAIRSRPLSALGLSRRCLDALRGGGITTFGHAADHHDSQLLNLKGFGAVSLRVLRAKLKDVGLG